MGVSFWDLWSCISSNWLCLGVNFWDLSCFRWPTQGGVTSRNRSVCLSVFRHIAWTQNAHCVTVPWLWLLRYFQEFISSQIKMIKANLRNCLLRYFHEFRFLAIKNAKANFKNCFPLYYREFIFSPIKKIIFRNSFSQSKRLRLNSGIVCSDIFRNSSLSQSKRLRLFSVIICSDVFRNSCFPQSKRLFSGNNLLPSQ